MTRQNLSCRTWSGIQGRRWCGHRTGSRVEPAMTATEPVMPDLVRHPGAALVRAPDWIAGRARNDSDRPVMPDLVRHPAAALVRTPDWIAGRARNDSDRTCHAG